MMPSAVLEEVQPLVASIPEISVRIPVYDVYVLVVNAAAVNVILFRPYGSISFGTYAA